jgi:probable addiction module antidote protein
VTKTYRQVPTAKVADEPNPAFASSEPHTICNAIGQTLKNFNVSEISKKTGLPRTSIYRAFGNERLPNFSTLLAVLTAMGPPDRECAVPRGGSRAVRGGMGAVCAGADRGAIRVLAPRP